MAGFSDPINISHVTGRVCTSVHSESVCIAIRMWLSNCGEREREREVTFPCLEGGMERGTGTGLAACGVDWNGDNKYIQSHIF